MDSPEFFNDLISELAVNIENFDLYLYSIRTKLFPHLSSGEKTESDYQELIASPLWMSLIGNKNCKYIPYSEYTVKNSGRLDHLFMPIQGSTAIIHEYKQMDNNSEMSGYIIDALWQIFANCYASSVVINNKVENIKARSIVFCQDKLDHKYYVDGFECEMTKENAKKINNLFENTKNLVGKISIEIYNLRKEFLTKCGTKNLSQLLFENDVISKKKKEILEKIEEEISKKMETKIKKKEEKNIKKNKIENKIKNETENLMEIEMEKKIENESEPNDELTKYMKIEEKRVPVKDTADKKETD